jgi:hypothetical protein
VYASLNEPESALLFERISAEGTAAAIGQRLGARVQQIADRQLTQCVEAARQALAAEDAAAAESILQSAAAWQPRATAALRAEWKSVQAETAASKKVLRFKKALRR